MILIKGRLVTPDKVFKGTITIENGRVVDFGGQPSDKNKVYDFGDALVVPGFIDVHNHGIAEFGAFELDEIIGMSETEIKFGITSFLPGEASLTDEQYLQFGRNVRQAQKLVNGTGARIIGAHFEGPFINPDRKGGMDSAYLKPMNLRLCQRFIEEVGDVLKLMTLSPELQGSQEVIRLLKKNNCVVSIGHSNAERADLKRAFDSGLTHVCHLFNTFLRPEDIDTGVWEPGLAEEVLVNHTLNCEVICDMHHVHPTFVKLAIKMLAPDRFIAITDSLPGAGLPEGEYSLADGRVFTTKGGVARLLSNNTVVGSVITMNHTFANLVEKCNVDPIIASRFTSTNAARALGIDNELGSIEVGKQADIAVLDSQYNCIATFIGGCLLYKA